eukprot:6178628-Pleurochrysis_carterae.AAC.1
MPWKEAFDLAKEQGRTEAEINACPHSLHAIRVRYGPIAERLIAMLLTFDALAEFREALRHRIPGDATREKREAFGMAFAQQRKLHNLVMVCTACLV